MRTIIAFTVIFAIICSSQAAEFAVLVAGSNGYYNYRHQADTCHAYKALVNKGVPAENIIVFAYNDIANDSENPFPGQLFNKPSTGPGVDVYAGCKIDYQGADVTPANYIAVITGNAAAVKGKGNGRVLTSTENDNVFLNFADHGGSGLIAFPSDYLYVNDFQGALKTMSQKKMFKQLTYYLEACESGSMFDGFPNNLNIYALSASNQTESSWGTYCSPDDSVDGKELNSCLGDLFSVNWMENLDASNTQQETLQQQFQIVHTETNQSDVMQWGQLTFTNEVIGAFEGDKTKLFRAPQPTAEDLLVKQRSVEDSRLIKLNYLKRRWLKNKDNIQYKREYLQEQVAMLYFVQTFSQIQSKAGLSATGPSRITDAACLKAMVENFEQNCHKFTEFGLKYVSTLANLCQNVEMDGGLDAKFKFVNDICKQHVHQQEKAMFIQ